MPQSADVVILGAGIAGTAAAYHLTVRHRAKRVVIIDERDPLTLTSDKGTQGYRNWWPGPDSTMLQFVSRSIDIMQEIARDSNNAIRMSRRGYVFVTGRVEQLEEMRNVAAQVSSYGMGELREHPSNSRGAADYQPAPAEGFEKLPDGADLLLGASALHAFPYLSESVRDGGALHIRRAGWMNAIVLGNLSLARAVAAGATFIKDSVTAVSCEGGRVRGVVLASGAEIATEKLVVCAGPKLHEAGRLLGIELPVFHELHAKITLRDVHGTVPRDAPFLIWIDGMRLDWNREEVARFAADSHDRMLLGDMPGGVHVRPVDGTNGNELYLIWTYENARREFSLPPKFRDSYAQSLLRGIVAMVPAMKAYAGGGADYFTDGGYYCTTEENRPLIGPLGIQGAYLCAALSGYGVMAAHGAGDLVAAHVMDAPLPSYAKWFLPSRYDDPGYMEMIRGWGSRIGQL